MRLSAPIFHLKRLAKAQARSEAIPLHEALDNIAIKEGFSSWSLLAAQASSYPEARDLYDRLKPGDLVLLAARPGQGKTMMGLDLIIEAAKAGRRGAFFTLEYNQDDIVEQIGVERIGAERIGRPGASSRPLRDHIDFDTSDSISADHIIARLDQASQGTLVVIDYLQLLDQKRDNPSLENQVNTLKRFAEAKGLIIVFISQIDRAYDATVKSCPDLSDVRLPNPLDLSHFNMSCFLNAGEVRIEAMR